MRSRLRDPEVAHRRRWYTLLVLSLSLMVIGLDNTILNVALPTLAKPKDLGGLGASGSTLQWIVDSYTLVFAGILLTAGSLGDRFGRYRGLTLGLVLFGTGSAFSAFTDSANVLVATRAIMGVGGAFIMPATLSIITNVFTDPAERAKAIGIWAGISAIGLGLGPVAGGTLLAHFWWGSAFLVNIPVVLVALTLGYVFIPDSSDPAAPKLDPVGALLSIAGLGALLWAIIEAPGRGWTSSPTVLGLVIGFVFIGAFLAWEATYSSPMLDLRFFENPRFSAASGAITLTFLALFGTIFLLTQYLQSVLGFSTIKAGAVLIPQSITLMVFALLSTRFVRRLGNKLVVGGGLLVTALALLLITTLDAGSSTLDFILVSMVMGMGMGNVMAPATDSIMGSLPREKAGVGSAMNDTTRQVGGAIGVAVFGSILSSSFSSHMGDSLSGHVPAALVGPARDSVGAALGVARDVAAAHPYAGRIVDAARESFVVGLHDTAVLGAVVIVVAALAVFKWLPARAADEPGVAPEGADARPLGIGPVDVVPAELAGDLAESLAPAGEDA